jgi:Mg2+/Co2+ transporter CorC
VIHALGRIPQTGDRVKAYGLSFLVASAAGRRVRRVRVSRPQLTNQQSEAVESAQHGS